MLRPLLGMLVAATMVPVAMATTDQLAPSSVVLSTDSSLGTTLSWTRGLVAAESYRVYGISNSGVPTFLVEVPAGDDAAWVLGGLPAFSDYGVAGVRGNTESMIQRALGTEDAGSAGDCLLIEPPNVSTKCGPYVGPIPPNVISTVKVPSPTNLLS